MYRLSPSLRWFAFALLAGAGLATLWVNTDPASYYDFIEWRIARLIPAPLIWPGAISLTPFMIATDMLMALVFFVMGKELWEAMRYERGALAGRRAILPLGMTLGGMAGAALAWILLTLALQTAEEAQGIGGWTTPLGSDALLVCLFGRMLFGRRRALHLVMLIAIATDLLALLILGLSNPNLSLRLAWLALPALVALVIWRLYGRRPAPGASEREKRAGQVLWPYLLGGALSWFGTAAAGMPGALGLLPMIPAIAHADRSFGLFAEAETFLHDPLNRLARLLIWPVALSLFLFGLIRGGVDLGAFAPTTLIMLGALWLGRPLGMILAVALLAAVFGSRLPRGLALRDLLPVIVLLSMGLTVPLIAIDAALPGGAMREAARLALAFSLLAGPLAVLAGQYAGRNRAGAQRQRDR